MKNYKKMYEECQVRYDELVARLEKQQKEREKKEAVKPFTVYVGVKGSDDQQLIDGVVEYRMEFLGSTQPLFWRFETVDGLVSRFDYKTVDFILAINEGGDKK